MPVSVMPFKTKVVKKNTYELDGTEYYRVTSVNSAINKPALIGWKANVTLDKARRSLTAQTGKIVTITPEWVDEIIEGARAEPDQVLTTARDFGSEAHYALERYILYGEAPPHVDLFRVIEGFNEWVTQNGVQMLREAEVTVAHRAGYAGTIDALGMKGDKYVIIDWKTAGGIYPEAMLQVAAYAAAVEEMTAVQVAEAWIVRFPREEPEPGEPLFYWARLGIPELAQNFRLFLSALDLYKGVMLTAGQKKLHDGSGMLEPPKKKK